MTIASAAGGGLSVRLAVCAIFKDEAPYLREWVAFHSLVGVEKFFLYDNGSTDGGAEVLAPFVESGLVTVHHFPRPKSQIFCYDSCIATYRNSARWMAFIDLDEFLFPTVGDSLVAVLDEFSEHPAVAVSWVMFNTSGHILRPEGLVLDSYTTCQIEGNRHVKLVVDPKQVESFQTPHTATFRSGGHPVNESLDPVDGAYSVPSLQRLRINHYWTKSVEDFLVRRELRGRATTGNRNENRGPEALIKAERNYSTGRDTTIQRFLPELRRVLDLADLGPYPPAP